MARKNVRIITATTEMQMPDEFMKEVLNVARSGNDAFMAGMAAHESATTRKLDNFLKDVDEAIYQLSRIAADHETLRHVVGHLQRSCSRARQP